MKMPVKPPDDWNALITLSDLSRVRVLLVRAADSAEEAKTQYLHWDELIHRDPPHGISHAEWWAGLKLSRNTLYKPAPLLDKKGAAFQYLETDPIPERLHQIDLGAGGSIEMQEKITNPETRDRYYVNSLIEEATTSSMLEGASTTRKVAKEMIRAGRRPRDRSEKMILNNFVTMRRIGELREESLTKELVFDIHRLVTDGTLDDASAAGRFRRGDERISVRDDQGQVLHEPPLAEELDDRMAAMCDFANGKEPKRFIHPAVRSIILHFWLAYDHPFVDGNGRTARALFYWSMLHHGFWLFEFVSISQIILKGPSKYSRAFLYTETDENDLTYFILYHLEVIHRAIDELHKFIDRKTRQLRKIERELRGVAGLNHRQRALIGHAVRHPHFQYTIASHRMSHDVVYQTARVDLFDLVDRELLSREKIGRTYYFTPTDDLEEKLRTLA